MKMEIINSKWDALLHPTFKDKVDNSNLPRFEFEKDYPMDQEYNKFFVPDSIETTNEDHNVVYHFPDGDLVFSI